MRQEAECRRDVCQLLSTSLHVELRPAQIGDVSAGYDGAAFRTVERNDDDWWSIRAEYGDSLGFQKVDGFTPPQWPGQDVPQQMHLDVVVDALDVAEEAVLELGATKHEHQPGTTFRVFLDPAGHPFCLCAD